jgi:hypothetical protein
VKALAQIAAGVVLAVGFLALVTLVFVLAGACEVIG